MLSRFCRNHICFWDYVQIMPGIQTSCTTAPQWSGMSPLQPARSLATGGIIDLAGVSMYRETPALAELRWRMTRRRKCIQAHGLPSSFRRERLQGGSAGLGRIRFCLPKFVPFEGRWKRTFSTVTLVGCHRRRSWRMLSTRQHTSAYVLSIRQHTSAYVSLRQ
jgi:hypothetical protein